MKKNKAIFFDRDGVINHDPGDYTMSLAGFHILPTVTDALKMATDAGFKVIVITNQGGIVKGLYTADEVEKMHSHLRSVCEKAGVEITRIYYSPHHPDFGNSLSRKPQPLLMQRALARYDLDPSQCVMIGDRERDVQCANAAGVRGVLMPTNAPLIDFVKSFLQEQKQA
ncbi:MAG: D-glycero-alpha-D-manno-heptose-1,7-bisphosphate 7-phosphatase [Flavobacteriales bacterium]